MVETIVYVLGSCECHPELTEEMSIPLRPISNGGSSSINWPSNRNWQTKVLDSWKVTQLLLLRKESVKSWPRCPPSRPIIAQHSCL